MISLDTIGSYYGNIRRPNLFYSPHSIVDYAHFCRVRSFLRTKRRVVWFRIWYNEISKLRKRTYFGGYQSSSEAEHWASSCSASRSYGFFLLGARQKRKLLRRDFHKLKWQTIWMNGILFWVLVKLITLTKIYVWAGLRCSKLGRQRRTKTLKRKAFVVKKRPTLAVFGVHDNWLKTWDERKHNSRAVYFQVPSQVLRSSLIVCYNLSISMFSEKFKFTNTWIRNRS